LSEFFFSSFKILNTLFIPYNHLTKSQAALISYFFKSAIEATKWASRALTASNNFYPTSLASVPAPILYNSNPPNELSSALVSHSAVSASTA